MELKQYAAIIWKRLWIPVALVILVGLISLATRQTPVTNYGLTMRFNVAVTPEVTATEYNYNGLHAWVTSEYMADSLSVLVKGQDFATNVNRRLAEMDSPAAINPGAISAETQHRVLTLNLIWPNSEELIQISEAVRQTMAQDSAAYFPQAGNTGVIISAVDVSGPVPLTAISLTQRLDIPVRLLLALVVGVGLAFLLDYLDDSVRGRQELETMGISVLAEVPKE